MAKLAQHRIARAWKFYSGMGGCGPRNVDGLRIPFGHRFDGFPAADLEDVMTTQLSAGSLDEACGTEFTALCGACGLRHHFCFFWQDRLWPPGWVRDVSAIDPAFDLAWRRGRRACYRVLAIEYRAAQRSAEADRFIDRFIDSG